jgi:hypothetical protein
MYIFVSKSSIRKDMKLLMKVIGGIWLFDYGFAFYFTRKNNMREVEDHILSIRGMSIEAIKVRTKKT